MDVATLLIEKWLPYPAIGPKELNNMGQVIYTCQLISKITYINAPFRKESGTPKCRHGILKSCESNEDKDIVYVCPYSTEGYSCPEISDGKIDSICSSKLDSMTSKVKNSPVETSENEIPAISSFM